MKPILSVLTIALALGTGACRQINHQAATESGESTAEPTAVQLDGWPGVNNIFREGDVYFAGQPDSVSWVRLANEAGVKTVVNIRYPEEMGTLPYDEIGLVESLGMRYVNIPVSPETLSPSDVENLAGVLAETDDPVIIHCGSSNRVGGFWAAYLAREEGIPLDEALRRGEAAGLSRESMIEAVRRVADTR